MTIDAIASVPAVRRWTLPSLGVLTLALLGAALLDAPNAASAGQSQTPTAVRVDAAPATQAISANAAREVIKTLTPEQKRAVEMLIRQYILENPEIIPEAISNLQNREVTKLLEQNRREIETPFGSAWAGAADGDVILVEFYDYACPYCLQARADVDRLLREDRKLKVVYRDYPVIAEASREAALASLSAASQGRHAAFYNAMFSSPGRVSHEKVVAAVRSARLNEMKTAGDLQAKAHQQEISRNIELGEALGLSGTPSYVVGNRVLVGAVGYDKLKEAIAEARARRAGG